MKNKMNIQGLKDKILQLAIQGKLVNQDPNDEPASVLLEKIKEERDRLVKEKKIKKQRLLPEITEEEKPFEIPEEWKWVRLGEVALINMGQSPKGDTVNDKEGMEFHQGKVYFGDIYLNKSDKYTTSPKKIAQPDDIILSVRAPVGTINITDREVCIGRGLCAISSLGDITKGYYFYAISAFEEYLIKKATGTTFLAITASTVNEMIIPLPPLAEQKRIVEKVDQLFALIDGLDSNKEDLLEVINLTRNQVLQEAIQGKLVEQNPEDEPASVLLEKIKKEKERLVRSKKIRKEKSLLEVTEEEKPYEIPKGWEWVRLGEVSNNYDSKRKPISVKNRDNLRKIYDYYGATGAIDKVDDFIFDGLYLLIGEDGGNFFNNKDVAFIVEGKFWANNHVHVLDFFNETLTRHIKNTLNSIDFEDRELITGIAVPKLNQTNLNNILIPLPPLAEQKRIVEKVDTIMNMLDELENELTTKI
ncbi:restriction endonuclease subunit S [Anaerosalibacter massiliensis]|nr:restriction endonuclease subunit S [Anaerosalibacter massiliensis]